MQKIILLVIAFLSSLSVLFSQNLIIEHDPYKDSIKETGSFKRDGCNPDLTVEPAFTCQAAAQSAINGQGTGFVCDLEGFCINTANGVPQLPNPIPFCSTNSFLNNPIWFSFIADNTGILNIDVSSSGCSGGVQWALYDQCGQYNNAIACQSNPIIPPNVPFNIYATGITPGGTYYLVIDGANGATCNYEFHVNDGISPVYVGDAIGTDLTGKTMVCGGSSVNYSFPGILYATDYHWALPQGGTIDSEGPNVTVNFPEGMTPGVYQLCVTGSNDCDENNDAIPVCWDITIGEEPIINLHAEVCPGSTYKYRNGNYPVGSYTFNYLGPAGTSCDTTVNLVVTDYQLTNTNDQQIFVCPGTQFAFIGGVPVSVGTTGNTLTYPDQHGCDSLVKYYVNELKAYGAIGAVPASLPCGGTASSTLTLNPDWGFFTTDTYSIEWFNSNHDVIGMGNSVQITNPGYYYAIVTWYKANNVSPGTNLDPLTILCDERFEITIPAENSTLVEPDVTGPTVLCAGQSYKFDTNTQTGTTSYNWIHVGGTVNSGGNNEHISLTYDTPGQYQICVNAVDGCGPSPDKCFQIQVVPSPRVAMDTTHAVCGINDTLRAQILDVPDVDDPNMQYIWTVVTGPDVSGVTFGTGNKPVTGVVVTQPGTYTFRFGADYNGQGCGATDTLDVTFEQALILTPQDVEACNDVNQPLPNIINLDTLVSGNGVAYTGTWSFEGGPGTPGGTLPEQDFTGLSQTGEYTYKFTPNQSGVCGVTPVEVKIDLHNCICPPLSINNNGGTTCNDAGSVNLNTLIQGGTGPGTWTVTTQPTGGGVTLAGGVADFKGEPSGAYVFTYTLTNTMAGCPATATTTVNVVSAPQAQLKVAEQACNSNFSPDYVNEINFDTLIVSGDKTGVWTYSGSGNDPGSASFYPKDFNGAVPGSYEYTYTVTGDPSCAPVTYKISIVVEDCKCPSVAITPFASFCNTTGSIDLDNYRVTTKAGKWHIESTPAGSNATITGDKTFNGTGSVFGTYVVYYKLDETVPQGCDDTSQLVLRLDSTAYAGADRAIGRCEDYAGTIDLDTVLTQQQAGGVWEYTGAANIGSSFNAGNGVLNMNGLPTGTGYTFNYTVKSPLGLCPDDKATVTVDKNVLPKADAGTDGYIDCVTTSVNLGGNGTSSGPEYSYRWKNLTTGNQVGSTAVLTGVQDGGTFELEVTNSVTGCVNTDQVVVNKDDKAIDGINIELDSISCYNKGDGEVRIIGVTGGTPDFKYSLDGSNYTAQSTYSNVGPGNHVIRVEDANGCKYDLPVYLDNPKEVWVELGNNKVIAEGDVVTITPDVSIGVNGVTIDWTSNPPGSNCAGCDEWTVRPGITTTYIATVRDKNGCTAVDSMEIRVKSIIRVFIPNVISPNNDGINDVFYVQTDQNIVNVKSMTIYNRWGDVQYSVKDIPPNVESHGWNGRFGEQRANTPAVFVYYIVLVTRDGREITYKGDVTVLR